MTGCPSFCLNRDSHDYGIIIMVIFSSRESWFRQKRCDIFDVYPHKTTEYKKRKGVPDRDAF